MNRMYRRWKQMTHDEVLAAVNGMEPSEYSTGGLSHGQFMPPYTDKLKGRKVRFLFDDFTVAYEFTGINDAVYTDEEGKDHEIFCMALESTREGIFLIHHHIPGTDPVRGNTIIYDTNTGAVTLVASRIGNEASEREVSRQFHFGKAEGKCPSEEEMHCFTKDLVGKAIVWKYKDDDFRVKHIYSSEYYYSYAMIKNGECWMASNPGDFLKVADDLYVFSFIEERQGGTEAIFLMDLKEMHDVGAFFGINAKQKFECYMVGAKGHYAPMETVFDEESDRYF